jgi:hypothetical protein
LSEEAEAVAPEWAENAVEEGDQNSDMLNKLVEEEIGDEVTKQKVAKSIIPKSVLLSTSSRLRRAPMASNN